MKKGRVDNAVRRALNILDRWNETSGVVEENSGYYYELQGVIEDAVHCGIQEVTGIKKKLDSEDK